MGNIQQKLLYQANIASIAAGQVVSIPAATHGLNSGKGALIPNYVHCAPLKATIDVATGDVLIQNTTAQTLTNVRVSVGYSHTLVGALDNPEGSVTLPALTPATPSTAQSAGVTGHIVARLLDNNTAMATGTVPLDNTLATTIAGATCAAGVLTLPPGTYVASWDLTATSSGTGLVTIALEDQTGAALGGSMSKTFLTGEEHILSGSGMLTLAATSSVRLLATLGAGAAGNYGSAGTAAAGILGQLHLQKIA